MNRYVVKFDDGDCQFVWSESKKEARKQMSAYANCKKAKIVAVY